MSAFCFRSRLAIVLALFCIAQSIAAAQSPDAADLPAPVSSPLVKEPVSIDDFGEGPVKAPKYRWLQDDPSTPTSPSTVNSFATIVDDVEPYNLLERPGIPAGWFSELELTATNPRISARENSGSLLSGTFADPVAPPFTPLDWTVMPKLTLGYRQPDGLGELSASYRFLFSQGSGANSQFGAGGYGSSRLQLHVLDLDYSLSDLFPNDLCFVPRQIRITGGVRIAGVYDKASASGGALLGQSASNTFVGAGPRFALEALQPLVSNHWILFTKFEGAGVIGSDWQSFSQTVSGPNSLITSASATSPRATVAVPVIGLQAGLKWFPDWGQGRVKMSTGFQWERWFFLGTDTTNSYNELTLLGPFLRGEVAF